MGCGRTCRTTRLGSDITLGGPGESARGNTSHLEVVCMYRRDRSRQRIRTREVLCDPEERRSILVEEKTEEVSVRKVGHLFTNLLLVS